jgi:general secretion pathway protein D
MGMRMLRLVVSLVALAGPSWAQTQGLGAELPAPDARGARAAYRLAQKAERKNDLATAFAGYKEASEKDPSNPAYLFRRELIRQAYASSLVEKGRFAEAYAVDPTNDLARQQANRLEHPQPEPEALPPQSRSKLPSEDSTPPLALAPKRVLKAWDLRGDTKALYLAIGEAYGIHFDFEDEIQPLKAHLTLGESDFSTAVLAVGLLTKSFAAPLTPRIALVAPDTSVKHQQYERQCVRVFDASELGPDTAITEVGNVLRNLLEMKWVQVNLAHKEILVRDETARVIQAAEIIRSLSLGQAQTVIEFQLLQVSTSRMRTLGILPTQTFSITPLAIKLGPLTLTPGTVTAAAAAATFGGGGTLMALTMPSAAAEAILSDSKTRSLQAILARGSDSSPATFTIGERYPIVTAVVTYAAASSTGATSTGIAGNSVPSFTYADIGLKVKVTPHVHGNGDITLVLEMTSTAIGTVDANGNPTIENREYSSQMRLTEGETVILSGMRIHSDSLTLTGLPGLAEIPGLGLLFGQRATDKEDDDLLMIVTPHVVRLGSGQGAASPTIAAPEHTVPVLK